MRFMSKTALILQHTPEERGGLFEEILLERGWNFEVLPLFSGAQLPPSTEKFGMTLVLGGPMSVNDDEGYPFLNREITFIKRALKLGHPVLGVCLGAQLMAKALGARVYPGPHKEIGWYWLSQTPSAKSDPLFSFFDSHFLVFQWHGETFELPPEAVGLAGNIAYHNQAFRLGGLSYGLQFHMEVTQPMIETWLSSWSNEIKEAKPQPLTARDILEDTGIYLDRLQAQGERFFSGYLSLVEKDHLLVI
jgi:GMP synthase (glutamine-hydrolysing)